LYNYSENKALKPSYWDAKKKEKCDFGHKKGSAFIKQRLSVILVTLKSDRTIS
jgi:hypothetical protein